jgi:hypothetical protein
MMTMPNKKWSKENGALVADFLCENSNLTQAAKLVGGGSKLVFHWMKASHNEEAAGASPSEAEYGIEWPEPGDHIFFHRAVVETQKRFLALAQGAVRSLLASPESGGGGHERIVTGADGKPAWLVDPLIAAHALEYDDDIWELTYGKRKRSDVFARDANGALIPWKVRDPIPSQTLIHLIRSLLPEQFDPINRTQADVTHHGAVLVLGDQPKETAASAATSPLRQDLEQRLAEIRARGPAVGKPNAPVAVFKDMRSQDQPDDGPKALPPPAAKPMNYAKPGKPSSGINAAGYGSKVAPPAGGFRTA